MANHPPEQYGLAEPLMLEKIDSLFACGVGELVDLPQIVVVGDQSSGKSSVLEGLIMKPLPRDSGLCTRFATQIVFRRAAQEQIVVSIIPDRDASPDHSGRMKAWGKTVPSLDVETFGSIMREAHEQMGLAGHGEEGERKPTFSNDVLRLEISGPDQEHLSVIDVPGIFKSTTQGLTTKADIALVRNMVKGYMDNPRSVMLAVIPANTDIATQEILELAAEADVGGDRTLGVLTKLDLVDAGAESSVIALIEGHARPMKLGWHAIRSPGQKDLQDVSLDRNRLEKEFFRSKSPWNSIEKEKVGVDSLRVRLKKVLSSLVKREFPKVKLEIQSRLDLRRKRRDALGPERNGAADQMSMLIDLATKFQRLVSLAVNATHGADDVFEKDEALRIAPAVMSRMKVFSDEMASWGEVYSFNAGEDDQDDPPRAIIELEPDEEFDVRKEEDHPELIEILHPEGTLPQPRHGHINGWLLEIFQGNRGFELGTFNASILATAMKKQCSKWSPISMGMVSDIIVLVHRFIQAALSVICPDRNVRDALSSRLSDELIRRYLMAISSAKFLMKVENSDTPMTLNHYFNENLQKSRQSNATANILQYALDGCQHGTVVKVEHITQSTRSMSNEEHVVQDIHDILRSYYKVSRKTFVDSICKQSAMYHLLRSEDGPLALFSPLFVSQLSASELEEIAGEDPMVRRLRAQLTKEITSLTQAMKIVARA